MVYNQPGRSDKTIEFLEMAEKIKIEVIKEITAHNNGKGKDGNITQLRKILDEVKKMSTILCPNNYTPSYPRIIVDSWDYNSKLGELLLDFYELYKKLN
ncbi:hypothetical protein [Parageobacillus thermoglucosidasius]|jgi:hypothetical protein|uniref:hypothetical protein n=2 Tax=Parageobacillus thermoglucosidasius TaxID=1426 RepID=UPI001FCC249F|nr:hypothetical protein [Parageobacillus thermoglucosidasius]MBY6268702.1 hypothetical protein [Parageobacillus thermoglucosidasius]MED4906394.1 hypothetical protein [Parageobacillus thermoglucosidasius]MED4915301.1 hypothetical protein [Parageobacillus thermoglucosidasius]MED4943978.1 hypothetical protein [Parageobacillus thermoglucosidasius]MED4982835.1 hypothetical protein [Parageobacillus thermoglucosidasius]